MSMFGALLPQNDVELGFENYDEVVDGYCAALEDVESEIASLESLSDAIDNAEAFAGAIESCGTASPALIQFGFAVDPDFGALIGRECPTDFASESMEEFGSFAVESVKSKLKLAWEKVKDFIIRLWEKLKEFGRWIVRLFDRKIQRLKEIAKRKPSNDKMSKAFNEREFKNAVTKDGLNGYVSALESAISNPADPIIVTGNSKAVANFDEKDVVAKIGKVLKLGGYTVRNGKLAKTNAVIFSNKKGSELGLTKSDIISMAEKMAKVLENRNNWESQYKKLDKEVAACKKAAVSQDKAADNYEKPDLDDDERRAEIAMMRKKAILTSAIIVTIGKITNNIAATVIGYASAAGM
ncbi:hypothetical protein [Paenibacillus sp.]